MEEWQLISTAPKDGRRILGYRPGFAENICITFWAKSWKEWQSVPGLYSWRAATHWMPLPVPPES